MDISQIAGVTNSASALANLILVTPSQNIGYQPETPLGKNPSIFGQTANLYRPSSFLFHYEGENTITLKADITDHYLEDNTSIQDQIALKPEMITVKGFIGELNNVVPAILQPLKQIADGLTVLSPYLPGLSATALIAYNKAAQVYATAANAVNAGVAAFDTITGANGGAGAQNKQQKAFNLFYGYFQNRTLFTVQTPWAIFKSMAIDTLRAVQDEDTRTVSTFELTFKKMRFAQTIQGINLSAQVQARLQAQGASVTQLGTYSPLPATSSLGSNLTAFGGTH